MCRFESGFFFEHELLADYEYYWRVEPSVKLFCDVQYDPFAFMRDSGKKYGFVISLYEYKETIPTLWETTKKFMAEYPQHIMEGNALKFVSDNDGKDYNNCHFVCIKFMNSFLQDMELTGGNNSGATSKLDPSIF